jgi:hypothetical protein
MIDGDTFRGEPPAFSATAEQVAATPMPGDYIRILRRSVSYMPDQDPPYFVTWEYERVDHQPTPPTFCLDHPPRGVWQRLRWLFR